MPGLSLSSTGLDESGFFRALILNAGHERLRVAYVISITLGVPVLVYWFFTSLGYQYKVMTIRADILRVFCALILVGVIALLFFSRTFEVEARFYRGRWLILAIRNNLPLFCLFVYAWTWVLSFAVAMGLRNAQQAYIKLMTRLEKTKDVR